MFLLQKNLLKSRNKGNLRFVFYLYKKSLLMVVSSWTELMQRLIKSVYLSGANFT